MSSNLINYISNKIHDYEIKKLDNGASKRLFYRISKNKNSLNCMD